MKIGIIELAINSNNKNLYYNDQEIGLGKALSNKGHFVDVYKFTNSDSKNELINDRLNVHYIHAKSLGNNTIVDTKDLKNDFDTVICFSDIQLSLPKVYKWAKKNKINFIPYIGVLESSSNKPFIRLLMSINKKHIISIYQKCSCLAKTEALKEKCISYGIQNVKSIPVGLDISLLNRDYKDIDTNKVKEKYGFDKDDKIVLLVGKLEEYRSPLDVVGVFKKLNDYDDKYHLLVVGDGQLKKALINKLEENNLNNKYKLIGNVSNNKMCEIYCIAERLLSFNKEEIFGMAILEAMYYGTPVFAIKAPGPSDIISNGEDGYLFNTVVDMQKSICDIKIDDIGIKATVTINNKYFWQDMIEYVENIMEDNN